ncbi:MAG: hypothetical protein WD672_13460, partial [Woeseia sp.]
MIDRLCLLFLISFLVLPAHAADGPDLELVMSDPDWIGNAPAESWWSDSGDSIYYTQKRVGEKFNDMYRVPAGGGDAELVAAANEADSANDSRVYNADRTAVAWLHRHDVMIRNLETGRTIQATRTTAEESALMFMANGTSVAFLRDGRYFIFDPANGVTSHAADIRLEKDPDGKQPFHTLRDQQMRTFETLRRDERRDEAEKSHKETRQKADPAGAPLPVYLGEDYAEVSRSLSPSGRYLLMVVKKKDAEDGQGGKMPNYVTEDGYLSITETRTRVGRKIPPAQMLLLIDLEERAFETIDYEPLPGYDDDPLASLRESAI